MKVWVMSLHERSDARCFSGEYKKKKKKAIVNRGGVNAANVLKNNYNSTIVLCQYSL